MENLNKPVIVPWDFSHVAENAYAHAVNVAKQISREIVLLHIVESEEAVGPSTEKLEAKAKALTKESGIQTHYIIRSGSIFETIRDGAMEVKAELVIMGTHGRKGVQKFTGSRALKVMANSKIPFLVVQEKPVKSNFERILFPVDFRKENKEKVNWVHYLSKNFGSTFVLFKRKAADRGFKKKIASNLLYAESFFKNNDVKYEIADATGSTSYEKEMVEYAGKHNIDMIIVLITRDIGWIDYLLAAKEQYVIANPDGIPVMCVNPKPAKLASGFRAAGG
jgi:nucleotide-binding universal stress UspA family protein